jgi:two-component system response regulator FlrC
MLQDCHTLPQIDSTLKVMEAQKIIDVLNETDGRRNIAAKRLNISPRTLRYKISKLKSIGVKVP